MGAMLRVDYAGEGLHERDAPAAPWDLLSRWVQDAVTRQAERADTPEPLTLMVATVDADGAANVRAVLMRFFDAEGPGFLTNLGSAKAQELTAHPDVAATLVWPGMYRAVRFRGRARELGRDEVAAYFRDRPWGSRISAWASQQSQPVTDRDSMEREYDRRARQWPDRGTPDDVPLPPFWGGYRIRCREVEFWAGRSNRLHDRIVYAAVGAGGTPALDDPTGWVRSRRQP